jgi:YD repeat-containing protein
MKRDDDRKIRAMAKRCALALAMVFAAATAGGMNAAWAANGSVTYTYDALGRITSVNYDTGVIILYSYDANGNRTQQVINVNTSTLSWAATTTPCTVNCWGQTIWH